MDLGIMPTPSLGTVAVTSLVRGTTMMTGASINGAGTPIMMSGASIIGGISTTTIGHAQGAGAIGMMTDQDHSIPLTIGFHVFAQNV